MKVPSPGESISEVDIAEWLIEDGDFVEKDQAIAEIDSDKATLELPAEESGKIKILISEGETVSVGDVVCIIDTSVKGVVKKDVDASTIEKTNQAVLKVDKKNIETSNKKTTPLAAEIIKSNNISIKDIKGTGQSGKITKSDVELSMGKSLDNKDRGTSRKKISSLRKKIASRLVSVKNETAMLTTFNEIDMTEIFKIRSEFKDRFKEKHQVNLGFMSFFTKAVTVALEEFKDVNAVIDNNEIIYHQYSDIGIAVSAPKGLMVPVLRNTEKMDFQQIELGIKKLAEKARDGKITIDEMMGGTFTITNGGVFGSMLSTPIINPPQSAILGMHNIVDRPVAINGEIKIRPIMYVALSYDHRIIDGRESVGFLVRVKELLEDPANHLMGGNPKHYLDL